MLANHQCTKRQGSCLLQASSTHTPYYSSEFYGDVLHEGITETRETHSKPTMIIIVEHTMISRCGIRDDMKLLLSYSPYTVHTEVYFIGIYSNYRFVNITLLLGHMW